MTGWIIARLHQDHRAAMVAVCEMSLTPWAVWWSWETCRLLQAGLWPYWDHRFALLFQAALLFIGYPLCVLIGGLWDTRTDGNATRQISVP
jgi:hypothetical protein